MDLSSPLQELQRFVSSQREQEPVVQGAEMRQPMVLRYPLPYPQDPSPPPLVPHRPAELQYGNPYSTDTARGWRDSSNRFLKVLFRLLFDQDNYTLACFTVFPDHVDVALSPEHMSRPPPEAPACAPPCAPPITPPSPGPGTPGWDREVVCIQPSRTTTPPESGEHPPQEPQNVRACKLAATKLKPRLV